MPGLNGIQMITKIKDLNKERKVEEEPKVIVCSAFSLKTFKTFVV